MELRAEAVAQMTSWMSGICLNKLEIYLSDLIRLRHEMKRKNFYVEIWCLCVPDSPESMWDNLSSKSLLKNASFILDAIRDLKIRNVQYTQEMAQIYMFCKRNECLGYVLPVFDTIHLRDLDDLEEFGIVGWPTARIRVACGRFPKLEGTSQYGTYQIFMDYHLV